MKLKFILAVGITCLCGSRSTVHAGVVPIGPFAGVLSETWEAFPDGVWQPSPLQMMGGNATVIAPLPGGILPISSGSQDAGSSGDRFIAPEGLMYAYINGNSGGVTATVVISFSMPVLQFGAYFGSFTGVGWDDPAGFEVAFEDALGSTIDTVTFSYSHAATYDGLLDWHGWRSSVPIATVLVTKVGAHPTEWFTVDNLQADVTVSEPNTPPVCQAFTSASAVAEGTAGVLLDGTASYDPDDNSLAYVWTQVAGPQEVILNGAESAQATFDAPLILGGGGNTAVSETYMFSLTVGDGQATTTCEVTVVVENVNHCPTAVAGEPATVPEGSMVNLNASASTDPDNDPLLFTWAQISGPSVVLQGADTPTPQFVAPLVGDGGADLIFQLTVDDQYGCSDAGTAVVHVDNLGDLPTCGLARASVAQLWPPNHKLVPVTVENVGTGGVPTVIAITEVRQDEPADGLGDGDTPCDASIAADSGSVRLRAERAGGGNGRVYHVFFTASNALGSCPGEVTVSVPSDKKPGRGCGDEGPIHPSCE